MVKRFPKLTLALTL